MSIPGEAGQEACGVVGVYSPNEDVARSTFFGLYALQHRGQESAGIAAGDGERIRVHTAMGLVTQTLQEEDLARLTGNVAVGHTRYSTTGSSNIDNAQPVMSEGPELKIALAHNGNIVNALELRDELAGWGCTFSSTGDSEIIAHLLTHAPAATWEERASYAMRRLQGAYSLAVMTKDTLLGIRDPMGVRPLSIGKLNGGWVLASETCALDAIGAQYERDIQPGEIISIDDDGLQSVRVELPQRHATCAFEYIYFSRPDSIIDKSSVHTVRRQMGRHLAQQHPVDADLVIGVPDSAIAAATGYAEEARLPYADGFVRNRYIGRTFIEPTPRLRKLGVRLKFSALPEVTRGKRVVMVDDTIVRGTTQASLVRLLREQGEASEVHVRITSPPIRWPCFLGIDIPDPDELIAHNQNEQTICDSIGADSLGYLAAEQLVEAIGQTADHLCLGCFTHSYPIDVQLRFDKFLLERPENLQTAMVFPREDTIDRNESALLNDD